jgi:hypothetical protein
MNIALPFILVGLFFSHPLYAGDHAVTGTDNNNQIGNNIYKDDHSSKVINNYYAPPISNKSPKGRHNSPKQRIHSAIVTIKYPNGSIYVGQVLKGKKHGTGTLTELSGATYRGEWKNDMRNGQGFQTLVLGYKLAGDDYNGEWLNDNRSGMGRYTYRDGSYIEGQFENNAPLGRGKMFYAAGDIFDGYFSGFTDRRGQVTIANAGGTFWGCMKDNTLQEGFRIYSATGNVVRLMNGNETPLMIGEKYYNTPEGACPYWPYPH